MSRKFLSQIFLKLILARMANVTAIEWANAVRHLVTKPACLPYPEKGGRQRSLIISCKDWLQAFGKLDEEMAFKWTTVVAAGFILLHKEKKSDANWKLPADQAESWGKKMSKRCNQLVRHYKQAATSKDPPSWAKLMAASPGGEEDQEVDDSEGEEEEADEDDEDEHATAATAATSTALSFALKKPAAAQTATATDYMVGYNNDANKPRAWRMRSGDTRKRLQYTYTWKCPDGASPVDACIAVWDDGYEKEIPEYLVQDHFPMVGKEAGGLDSKKLLPRRKKKGNQSQPE